MIMNSWKSIGASECAPPFRMFIIGTGKTRASGPPRYRNSGDFPRPRRHGRSPAKQPSSRVGAEIFFVRRTVEFDQFLIDLRLVSRIQSFENRRNLLVHVGNRLSHAFAAEAAFVAVAQFPRFMFACARPAGNRRSSKRAAFKPHIDFDGRIAA